VYTGLARKLGLIDRKVPNILRHPQVIDLSFMHHKLHAACAFYRSGWDDAACLIVDGAGTFYPMSYNDSHIWLWETESIIDCQYPAQFKTLYKHYGAKEPIAGVHVMDFSSAPMGEEGETHEAWITDRAGIVKVYEGVTEYCGFSAIEAGKTMGLASYGNLTGDRPEDLARQLQEETKLDTIELIKKAISYNDCKNIVLSGGYALNCVNNYEYLKEFPDHNFFVDPVAHDGGTAIGAALWAYRHAK
jgi:carbamoyltransferase